MKSPCRNLLLNLKRVKQRMKLITRHVPRLFTSRNLQRPQAHLGWNGVWDGTEFRDVCPQLDYRGRPVGNEDCLFLNVFTPGIKVRGLCIVLQRFTRFERRRMAEGDYGTRFGSLSSESGQKEKSLLGGFRPPKVEVENRCC